MTTYLNISRNSSVTNYTIRLRGIIITFSNSATHGGITSNTYKYTIDSAGEDHIREMKVLASAGRGLNGYINRNKPRYESRS